MFGNYLKTIDEKNRIVIPSNFRAELGDVFYVSLGLDKIIEIRNKFEFQKIKNKINEHNSLNKNVRDFARFFFGNTTEVSCDKLGRVILPKNLLSITTITKEAYLIGVGEKLELWPKDRYEAENKKFTNEEELEEMQKILNESGVIL
ncbi:division/cell wall cluster transcriptional repressor MraZ [Mesomycoplasma neurolyticum]|uniref:Transcriptional regulator MraZ n=1 Tax=Mesomycoplasma neurolyticum TaxID=2120 RepID=A0A449A4U3_9BACT|nr:division/cell wall cluster transcriptional repressor MraZ [Mesomycoplasma neurolyticum]VEU59242.1 Protein mraZ [Mesomycoplasma neurolyticum]